MKDAYLTLYDRLLPKRSDTLAENLESRMVYIDDAWDHDASYYPFERGKENRLIRESETQYM